MFAQSTYARIAIATAIIAVTASTKLAQAQQARPEVRQAIEAARQTNPRLVVRIDPGTGLPSSIKGITPRSPAVALTASRNPEGQPSEADVRRAVEGYLATSEIGAAFQERHPQAVKETTQVRRDPDVKNQSVVTLTQRVAGIPVFGSSAKVVVNPELAITEITASFSSVAIESTTPGISVADSISVAREHIRQQLTRRARDPGLDRILVGLDTLPAKAELNVFDPMLMKMPGAQPGPLRLTWLVSIDSMRVLVDAQTRDVAYFYRDQPNVMVRRVYDLASGFPGQKVLDEATGERTDPLPEDAQRAFQSTGAVRDFYYLVFGRDGIAGGAAKGDVSLESYVRYSSLTNAFWCKEQNIDCPAPNVMIYGLGFAGAIDVVGHEVTHGIIAHEADLVYADEPGAVNEAFADIFGTLIEFHAKSGNGNWVIGETLPGYSESSPMRSLADPHLSKATGFNRAGDFLVASNRGQPDHYDELVHRSDRICDSSTDFFVGCVHINSGVLNKFAYLISEGGQHRSVTVTGIGRNKLARIAYRALTTRLNQTSGLMQAADAFVAACSDLAGAGAAGITAQDCIQVDKARLAVGLVPAS